MSNLRFSADEIHEAYLDCRRRKRGTANALRFEMNQAGHLLDLEEELNSGSYRPSRSVCFVNLRPKPREIFAADFRDRVVHHLFVREIERHWERVFIHDSYACRPGKGTHAAVDRLEEFVRSVTRGGRSRAWFLQFDVHNFFMSIDREILFRMIDGGLGRQYGVPKGKLPLFCRYLAHPGRRTRAPSRMDERGAAARPVSDTCATGTTRSTRFASMNARMDEDLEPAGCRSGNSPGITPR